MKKRLLSQGLAGVLTLSMMGAAVTPAAALAEGAIEDGAVYASAELESSRIRWNRLAGADRYQTARMVVDEEFRKANSVVVASGDNYPDALAASAVAGALGSPVILTPGHHRPLDAVAVHRVHRVALGHEDGLIGTVGHERVLAV